ncbi:MAG: type II toxin-antitoxin system RelE/ParE family toxin [Brevundimonas sp.]|nr:type II toxin-antitoxin system RelE/ParE family toxin [Brevundimonas sp.]MDP1914072.1 type II toxin-antitoxin system RelE/ParE family toxin [Brevundimonas sp.]
MLERRAKKVLGRIPAADRTRILTALDDLAADPFGARNVKSLQARQDYRLRVGDYRVVYNLERNILTVFVIEISQRSGAYR